MKKRIQISVAVITYNQEKTITQTLDSILAQKGDFDLELVIGEDCSTDNTYAICQEYASRSFVHSFTHSVIIKLLPNTHNLGIMANFARVMKACTGDYVGMCAGDDYWCDEHKLQKQLDYFRTHPEVGVVTTAGYKHMVKSNTLVPNAVAPILPIEDGNIKRFYFSSSYQGGLYAMPLTMLIRSELMQYIDFDEFVRREFPVEDLPMQAVLAQHCKWGHINDLCVVYRVYKDSASFISFDHPKYLAFFKGMADIRRYLNELFPDDVCISETQLQEDEFYKKFLLSLHQKDYNKAKQLISGAPSGIANGSKVRQARRFTKTWLHFIAAHYIKEYKYRKDIKART